MRWARHSGVVVTAAVVLFAAITVLRWSTEDPLDGVTVMYTLPVALLASRFGFRTGVVASLSAFALMLIWIVAKDIEFSALAFTSRFVSFLAVGMAVGARIIERLEDEGYLGPEGRVALLGRRVERRFEALARRCPDAVSRHEGIGAMHAFVAFDGKADVTDAVLRAAWDEGLLVFTAGSHPTRIRLLLAVNTTDEELEAGFAMLEKALRRVAGERGIPC